MHVVSAVGDLNQPGVGQVGDEPLGRFRFEDVRALAADQQRRPGEGVEAQRDILALGA